MSRARLRRFFRHGLLPQLFVFEAVARLGSVTRAAEELHLAQPTVSLQLKKLADTLGLALFEQRGRRLYLTPGGHALRDACDELLHLLARTEARLEQFRNPSAQVVRLAAEPEARETAARLIAAFCARHPGIQASLRLAERAELLARFAAAQDDVYLFQLEVDGLPQGRRWSLAHATGRELSSAAGVFLREALVLDALDAAANNGDPEEAQWKSRANTTRP
jgi:LysR family transcriptional regulator, low CO2-responsive transcriptional regulator